MILGLFKSLIMKYITIISILLVLLSCSNSNTLKEENNKYKTIMLKTEGFIETVPDMASFSIRLECLDKNIKVSKQCLIGKSNELMQKLLRYGIDSNDILTTTVSLYKSYEWNRNTRTFIGYQASTSLNVRVKNLDNLDIVYTDLIDNQNLSLGGLTYSHSKLDSLKNEAYLEALSNANKTAEVILSELPEKKKEVIKISNVKISSTEFKREYAATEAEDDIYESINISYGAISVNASLYVEYLIK